MADVFHRYRQGRENDHPKQKASSPHKGKRYLLSDNTYESHRRSISVPRNDTALDKLFSLTASDHLQNEAEKEYPSTYPKRKRVHREDQESGR